MKHSIALLSSYLFAGLAAAHTAEGTPGIELHHMPIWGWVSVGLLIVGVLYAIYAVTHGKPLNPLEWK